ncbi:hypothetical protein KPH14_010320 [Odynerus spinipes]|uniref:Uncharacterized protein n=1 Tax=Odynerus spinipes TaxID=1348599 RepID=A0AAD9VTP0_9HYME|nr:hypothetical protein KPH14_010320 [Odynerus spinipes]
MQFSAAKFLFNETEFHRKNAENPSSPFAPNVILISEKLVERLQNGSVGKEDGKEDTKEGIKEDGKEDTEEDDRYWAEKLATLDEEHTKRNKLGVNDTEKLFRNVVNYARRTHAKLCPLDQTKVRDCYINNRCHTLQCTTEINQ